MEMLLINYSKLKLVKLLLFPPKAERRCDLTFRCGQAPGGHNVSPVCSTVTKKLNRKTNYMVYPGSWWSGSHSHNYMELTMMTSTNTVNVVSISSVPDVRNWKQPVRKGYEIIKEPASSIGYHWWWRTLLHTAIYKESLTGRSIKI